MYGLCLKTASMSVRGNILSNILKCLEHHLILKMAAPLIMVLKSLNV